MISDFFFLQLWYGLCSFSKIFSTKNKSLICLPYYFFHHCSKQKKGAFYFCEDLSNFQPVNSDLRPFRVFWMMSVPKEPPLKLKLAFSL